MHLIIKTNQTKFYLTDKVLLTWQWKGVTSNKLSFLVSMKTNNYHATKTTLTQIFLPPDSYYILVKSFHTWYARWKTYLWSHDINLLTKQKNVSRWNCLIFSHHCQQNVCHITESKGQTEDNYWYWPAQTDRSRFELWWNFGRPTWSLASEKKYFTYACNKKS